MRCSRVHNTKEGQGGGWGEGDKVLFHFKMKGKFGYGWLSKRSVSDGNSPLARRTTTTGQLEESKFGASETPSQNELHTNMDAQVDTTGEQSRKTKTSAQTEMPGSPLE